MGNKLTGPHNTIHESVGGVFGKTTPSCYDPLFWVHHVTVDRQWALWQESKINQEIPNVSFGKPFASVMLRDVVDYQSKLGYRYDNLGVSSEPRDKPVVLIIEGIHMTAEYYYISIFFEDSVQRRKYICRRIWIIWNG